MFVRSLVALTLLSFSAFAAPPTTILLPTSVVSALAQYLSRRPYADVADMIAKLQECVAAQVPNEHGSIVSRGGCPEVTEAIAAKKKAQ